jgi:hypothetical protein
MGWWSTNGPFSLHRLSTVHCDFASASCSAMFSELVWVHLVTSWLVWTSFGDFGFLSALGFNQDIGQVSLAWWRILKGSHWPTHSPPLVACSVLHKALGAKQHLNQAFDVLGISYEDRVFNTSPKEAKSLMRDQKRKMMATCLWSLCRGLFKHGMHLKMPCKLRQLEWRKSVE